MRYIVFFWNNIFDEWVICVFSLWFVKVVGVCKRDVIGVFVGSVVYILFFERFVEVFFGIEDVGENDFVGRVVV